MTLKANQGQAAVGVVLLVQMLGRLDKHDLEGGPDVRLQQMASAGCPIRPAEHHVGMDLGLSVLECDVTHQRENFDLLADRNLTVFFRLPVEVADCRFLEGSNSRESVPPRWF